MRRRWKTLSRRRSERSEESALSEAKICLSIASCSNRHDDERSFNEYYFPNDINTDDRLLRRTLQRSVILLSKSNVLCAPEGHYIGGQNSHSMINLPRRGKIFYSSGLKIYCSSNSISNCSNNWLYSSANDTFL
jgi:hypothetical protein